MSKPNPVFTYSVSPDHSGYHPLRGQARCLTRDGRSGIHFSSVKGCAVVPKHTLAADCGTILLWVLPLQEMFPACPQPAHASSNPFFNRFNLISDREATQDTEASLFSWLYTTDWHPVMIAKFGPGSIEAAIGGVAGPERVAFAATGHFEMPRMRWQQMAVTWDHPKGEYYLWCNGVKIGAHDTTQAPGEVYKAGPNLFVGSPGFAVGESQFYDQVLSPEQLVNIYDDQAGDTRDKDWQQRLRKIYTGEPLEAMPAAPAPGKDGWSQADSYEMDADNLLPEFFIQGASDCFRNTDEGLRVFTPSFDVKARLDQFVKPLQGPELELTRTYLWTRKIYEGDTFLSVDFKIHAHGGLGLLIASAAGMLGEDFLEDYYPLRTDGSMRCVCWEDLRNYHWEFYREMKDVRNDLVSHAVLKNPWFQPASFQIENRTWELEHWYTLTWFQQGDHVRGAIDGKVVVDFTDNGFGNNGPVLRNGRFALRAMMRTDMTFRNLRILERPDTTSQTLPANPACLQ